MVCAFEDESFQYPIQPEIFIVADNQTPNNASNPTIQKYSQHKQAETKLRKTQTSKKHRTIHTSSSVRSVKAARV